jgi:Ca-activated chloride channel homolog
MSLSWPWALAALLAFPLLLGYRWWTRRRKRRSTVRLPNLALVRAALPGRTSWKRRIPLWLFALGLVVLGVGAARPQATVPVASDSSSILLVIDESTSMCSTDVSPNRITAAENAARDFIRAQPNGTKIGLVAFSGIPALLVEPTSDKSKLLDAVGTLKTSRGTAIGLGILAAIDAIAQINPDVAPTGVELPSGGSGTLGGFVPDTIVVLTDGANTQGVDPVTAAKQAAGRHLRIYTIGFGTTQPAAFVCTPDQIGGGAFGGGGFGPPRGGFGGGGFGGGGFGGRNVRDLDEATLTQVANITGGKYFQAKDAKALSDVLMSLPKAIVLQHKKMEITVWFALAGAVLLLAGIGLAQWWSAAAAGRRRPATATATAAPR